MCRGTEYKEQMVTHPLSRCRNASCTGHRAGLCMQPQVSLTGWARVAPCGCAATRAAAAAAAAAPRRCTHGRPPSPLAQLLYCDCRPARWPSSSSSYRLAAARFDHAGWLVASQLLFAWAQAQVFWTDFQKCFQQLCAVCCKHYRLRPSSVAVDDACCCRNIRFKCTTSFAACSLSNEKLSQRCYSSGGSAGQHAATAMGTKDGHVQAKTQHTSTRRPPNSGVHCSTAAVHKTVYCTSWASPHLCTYGIWYRKTI